MTNGKKRFEFRRLAPTQAVEIVVGGAAKCNSGQRQEGKKRATDRSGR